MALETTGEIIVNVDRQTAFDIVRDPQRFAGCIPGCHDVVQLGPDKYTAVLSSKVAFMTLSFKVTIDVTRMDSPEAIDATITGDAVGLAGRVAATAGVRLMEDGPERTCIRYRSDVALTGKLGGLGQPVFRATSARISRQFGDNLKALIESGPASTVDAPA
jgi:carbon monoxide dehydrogenase subunit G